MTLPPFSERVRKALEDDHLHVALERATLQLGSRRSTALSSLEHCDAVRDAARRIKMETLRRLGDHLETFEKRLVENGAQVHWADRAEDANRIVLEIARGRGLKRVVKAKSMATEETHLNRALIDGGLEVVETDLGEYIVQLAKDRPSHIILPIIHLTREDVGKVMHETIDVPYSDDTQRLARYAREKLRGEFLQADMGITGANFGVVEDGTICIVTNEGNGRMVSSLPRVHVVFMGIEKLVPTMADLDLFLKILARSATGQKLTSYTTLIRGPKGAGEESGPDELHVILMDNGRTRILAGETAEILGCIRCGACLNVCPVYKNIGGHAYGDTYPGPVGAVVTPGLRGLKESEGLPEASTLCGACRDVCPVRLDIPRMLLSLRRSYIEEEGAPLSLRLAMKLFGWAASHPGFYRTLGGLARWFLRRRAEEGWIKQAPGPAKGWTEIRDLKAPAERTFQELWRD